MNEGEYKLILKKWWLHLILMGAQFCLGTLLNYSLYHFIHYENDYKCGMPMLGDMIAQWFLFFIVLIPLILRMVLGKGFKKRDYVLTISLLLLNPIFNLALFLS
jgi:hypothetical protein